MFLLVLLQLMRIYKFLISDYLQTVKFLPFYRNESKVHILFPTKRFASTFAEKFVSTVYTVADFLGQTSRFSYFEVNGNRRVKYACVCVRSCGCNLCNRSVCWSFQIIFMSSRKTSTLQLQYICTCILLYVNIATRRYFVDFRTFPHRTIILKCHKNATQCENRSVANAQ